MTPTNENRHRALPSFLPSFFGCLFASAHLFSLFSYFARSVRFPFCRQDHFDLAADINVLVKSTCSWSVSNALASRLPAPSPLPLSLPFPREYHGERLFLHDRKPLRTAEILSLASCPSPFRSSTLPSAPFPFHRAVTVCSFSFSPVLLVSFHCCRLFHSPRSIKDAFKQRARLLALRFLAHRCLSHTHNFQSSDLI